MVQRIHILGASGSGTTTLGQALSEHLQCPYFETDTYFWLPTDPPFIEKRERQARQQLLMDDLTEHEGCVVSGSLCRWGDVAIPLFELVVFLWIPSEIRLERLCQREHERYGDRIMPGGDMYEKSQEFLDWAVSYDTGGLDMRSRQRHEQWLSSLPCPIILIEGEYAIEEQLAVLMAEIQQ
ncbi:MAG: AAA family ATPase [bacterium]|nr:AAA family ATPase [bacterium]